MKIITKGNSIAVIVAIEDYRFSDKKTGITPVKYARNDAAEFRNLLLKHFSLDENQITLWIDNDATKSALENELPYIIRNLAPSDRFYFYYAGHGFYQNGMNHITAWDTHPTNLVETSVSLKSILIDPLENSESTQSLIFLDACASNLTSKVSSRDLISNMDKREFEDFIRSTNFSSIYWSCSPGEKSYPSQNLNHGIWTWHLLKALSGDAEDAIVRDLYITDSSLKDYLRQEVPKYIRKNTNIKSTQTPFAIVSASNTFEIRKLPEQDEIKNHALEEISLEYKEYFLRSIKTESISRLSGFDKKKRHFIPDYVNSYADNFVKNLLEDDVLEELKVIYYNTKTILKLRKREIEKSPGHGGGTIDTDLFRYVLDVEQNPNDPTEALITRKLILRVAPSQLPEDFDNIFPEYLNEIVIPISGSLDFDDLVEAFENIEEKIGGNLEEDEDEGIIEYKLKDNSATITVHVFAKQFTIRPKGQIGCLSLIEKAENSLIQLTGIKKKLLK